MLSDSDIRSITNLSEAESMAVATISIGYNEPLIPVEAVIPETLLEMPKLYPHLFKEELSCTGVEALAASTVDLKVVDPVNEKDIFSARRALNCELKLVFDAHGINIPFPQLVIHEGIKIKSSK